MSHRVLFSMSPSMPQAAHRSSLLFGFDVAKRCEEAQIIDTFQDPRDDEWGAQRQRLEQGSRQGWGGGLRHGSGCVRYAGGGGALVWVHHRHYVGLPGGNVHLG